MSGFIIIIIIIFWESSGFIIFKLSSIKFLFFLNYRTKKQNIVLY